MAICEFSQKGGVIAESRLVCEEILDLLYEKGLRVGFGVPGGALALFVSMITQDSRFRVVLSQHETGAAYMALGYNSMIKETQDWAFCFSTSGPGATNMLTGVGVAYEENVPLLAITGNCSSELFGRGGLQDSSSQGLDICGLLSGMTAGSVMAASADSSAAQLGDLWDLALRQRKPVHFNFPIDISKQKVSVYKDLGYDERI